MEKECPSIRIMNILSKKWMLIILRELSDHGYLRFGYIIKRVNGISSRTLSKRLKELEDLKIVKREQFNETPPRVEYSLTSSGKEIIRSFKSLDKWSLKNKITHY